MARHQVQREMMFVSPASSHYASFSESDCASGSLFESMGVPSSCDSRRMSRAGLLELRDYLVKTSIYENPVHSSYAPLVTSVHKLQPLGESHFINIVPCSDSESTTRLTTHMPLLPRASVAVLIDAVRASVLPDDEKTRFLFDLFDADGCGVLTREGVAAFIDATLLASNLETYGDLHVEDIVAKLFAGTVDSSWMEFHEFQHAFHGVVNGRKGSLDTPAPMATPKVKKGRLARLKKQYKAHASEVHWLILYVLLMAAAFFTKAYYVQYDLAVGYGAKIAKGFAQIVMVNTLFLLLPICRMCVAFLRKFAAISSRLPVDQNIEFHKICGVVMLLASLGHSVAWVFNAYYMRTVPDGVFQRSRYAHLTFVRNESIPRLLERTPMWTGVLMVLLAAVAAPLTHPKIRRGVFNAFWLTHLMLLPFLVLIVVHGLAMWVQPPQAYYWVLPPLLLYAFERRFRVKATSAMGGNTQIQRVQFSKETVAIFMDKPHGFHFHPGMYLFLKVPLISTYEWHPFTISSAPEDDYLSVHVRNAGDWTGALHAVLRQCLQRCGGGRDDDLERGFGAIARAFPAVFIDGPVGAPSQDYYRYESVVFVGAGIGVTPFASILQSIVHQWEAFRCDRCNSVKLPKTFKLKKIYFYWITREQEALTWFAETMNRLSALDVEGRLEIHNYYSPLKEKTVIAPLYALQKFIHDSEGRDIISGLTTKQLTHFGRPDWQKELYRIAAQQDTGTQPTKARTREIGVFFCGPKLMGNQIHSDCAAFNQDEIRTTHNVVFDFHSENF